MKINTCLDFQGNEIKLATPERVTALPDSNLFVGRTCILVSEKEVDETTISVGSIYYYNGEQWCGIEGESLEIDETKINVIDDEITLHKFDTLSDAATYVKSNKKVKSIIIGSNAGVTSISEAAFMDCTSLTSITIPDSVTSIGDAAFYSCTSLTSITIPDSVTRIGGGIFYGCTSLTSITIPSGVTSIGGGTFQGCTSLTSITIPNGVTSIGMNAFNGCTSLTSITIPNSVTRIDGAAFMDCTSLTSITIPNGVTSIGMNAFNGCTSLTSITIPNGVTSIGKSAFNGCDILMLEAYKDRAGYPWGADNILIQNEDVTTTIDESSTDRQVPTAESVYNFIAENILSMKFDMDHLKEYIERTITSIDIPDGVTNIGNDAFSGCTALTSVTIPNSVTSIGEGAFFDCKALTSITINKPKESITGSPWGATKASVKWIGG